MNINILILITGLLSLSLEMLGAQAVFLFFPQSSQALGIALSSFFMGLALASFLVGRYFDQLQQDILRYVSFSFFVLTVFILFYLYNFSAVIYWGLSFQNQVARAIFFYILCGSFLLIPALFLGGVFPLLAEKYKINLKNKFAYYNMWDLVGALTGCLVVGFVLLPILGLQKSFVLMAVFSAFTALVLQFKISTVVATVLLWCLFWFSQSPTSKIDSKLIGEILFQKNSSYGTVSVTRQGDHKSIYINYREMCAGNHHVSEKELARLALDEASMSNLSILNIGLGCGFTAEELASSPRLQFLDIAEINPVIVEASEKYFYKENNNLNKNKKIKKNIEDGFAFLQSTTRTYDIILVDIEEPTIIHSSAFYTVDGFQRMKSRLSSNGLVGLWSFEQHETAKIIFNSLKKVFKHVIIYPSKGKLLFYGSDKPIQIPISDVEKRQVDRIHKLPIATIATIENNPYSKYYKIDKIFKFPKNYKDEFARQ